MEVKTITIEQVRDEDVCLNVMQSNDMKDVDKAVETKREENIFNGTTNYAVAAVVYEQPVPDVTRFSYEVQHGYRVYCELLSDQYKAVTRPFIEPVDVESLGLWDYYTRIETPMSFKQIERKFKSYLYQNITEIISDIRLILENCYRYNGSNHWISKVAQKLENILDQKLALLNRSLRDKVSLQATMSFRNNKIVVMANDEPDGRRRRSGRSSHSNGINTDQTSRLVNHLILEEEETQKELRRQKEKEKKEANEALMQELNEWENEIFSPEVLSELRTMWEIPSIGSFLWLFQEALNLPELNYTEFENGLVIPHKSHLMAMIFSSVLVTPYQRKSIHKKPPMRFPVWEKKLKERMDLWYITREAREFQLVAHQIGLDNELFGILGNTNPLEKNSYIDLSLHQRVLILKALCDECLDYEPQLRDYLGNADTTPFREIILGNDSVSCSYVYFPIFEATDLRIYKQAPLPSSAEWYRTWKSNYKAISAGCLKQGRVNQSRSRKSTSKMSASKSKVLSTNIQEGFELVCCDIESLRDLCEKFSDHTTTPSSKKRRGRPPRQQSEKLLHDALVALLEELGVSEGKYSKARVKGMLNLMKEWNTVEEPSDSGDESIEQSEHLSQDDDADNIPDEPLVTPLVMQPNLLGDGARGNPLSQERTEEGMLSTSMEIDTLHEMPPRIVQGSSLVSMVTRSRNRTSRRVFSDQHISTTLSSASLLETPACTENRVDHISSNNAVSENPVNKINTNLVSIATVNKSDDVISGESKSGLYSKNGGRLGLVSRDNAVSESSEFNINTNLVAMEANDTIGDVISSAPKPALLLRTIYSSGKLVEETIVSARIPVLESKGVGNEEIKRDCGDNKDSCGREESCGGENHVNDTFQNSMNLQDMRGIGDNDGYVGINGDIDGDTDLVHVDDDKVVVNEETSCNKTVNIMDTRGIEDMKNAVVYQNGKCKQLQSICNGAEFIDDYEPANKRHCSADTRDTVKLPTPNELATKTDNGSLETSHQSPVKTTLFEDTMRNMSTEKNDVVTMTDDVSVETNHQSPVKTTLSEDVVTMTDNVSVETSHQSLIKPLGEGVQNHVISVGELVTKTDGVSMETIVN